MRCANLVEVGERRPSRARWRSPPRSVCRAPRARCAPPAALRARRAWTQSYTYEVFLWRAPIILTTKNWCLDALTDEEREWLGANCVAAHVTEPVFKKPKV